MALGDEVLGEVPLDEEKTPMLVRKSLSAREDAASVDAASPGRTDFSADIDPAEQVDSGKSLTFVVEVTSEVGPDSSVSWREVARAAWQGNTEFNFRASRNPGLGIDLAEYGAVRARCSILPNGTVTAGAGVRFK